MKYKVGDRVIGIAENVSGKDIRGLKGTVIYVRSDGCICVEFNKYIKGHSGYSKGKCGHCWWLDGLTHVKKCPAITSKIVITSDGTETLARLYENGKVVKSATAKCSPEDEFNFNIGARLAFDRLIEYTAEKKEEYFSGKVVCVERGENFAYTVGKIYEFKNGKLVNDNGYLTPETPVETLDKWNAGHTGRYAKFIPLVEETKGE